MKRISRKVFALFMVLVVVISFSAFTPAIAETQTSRSAEVWSEGVVSDDAAVSSQLIQTVFEGNAMKLTYRIINKSNDKWSEISWKTDLKGAAIVATTYSEFPSMYKTLIAVRSGVSKTLMPPNSIGVITIVIAARNKDLSGLSVSVGFDPGKNVQLSGDLEKYLLELREPDPDSLIEV